MDLVDDSDSDFNINIHTDSEDDRVVGDNSVLGNGRGDSDGSVIVSDHESSNSYDEVPRCAAQVIPHRNLHGRPEARGFGRGKVGNVSQPRTKARKSVLKYAMLKRITCRKNIIIKL